MENDDELDHETELIPDLFCWHQIQKKEFRWKDRKITRIHDPRIEMG